MKEVWTPNGPVIKKIPANTAGKDFLVGDLHGHFDALQRMLKDAGFNPKVDRLFSVGDLVDRGPKPIQCLELLAQPWFHAVVGNHDYNTLIWGLLAQERYDELERLPGTDNGTRMPRDPDKAKDFLPWDPDQAAYSDGGEWLRTYIAEPERLNEHLERLKSLPNILQVGEGEKRFHVVHAGLHFQPHITATSACTDEDVDNNVWDAKAPQIGAIALMMMRYDSSDSFEGLDLSTTYCGHTPQPQPTVFAKHINIDTGAGKGGYLTLFEEKSGQFWQRLAL